MSSRRRLRTSETPGCEAPCWPCPSRSQNAPSPSWNHCGRHWCRSGFGAWGRWDGEHDDHIGVASGDDLLDWLGQNDWEETSEDSVAQHLEYWLFLRRWCFFCGWFARLGDV